MKKMRIFFYESENDESAFDEVESHIIPQIGTGIYLDDLVFVKSVYINYAVNECMVYFIRASQ